jgi:hypothetical protein
MKQKIPAPTLLAAWLLLLVSFMAVGFAALKNRDFEIDPSQ